MSWTHTSHGLYLFSSRDEKHTRAKAHPPSVRSRAGIRYLAPADGDHGGTWVAANERGLVLCLLNGRPDGQPAGRFLSRGFVVPSIVEAQSTDHGAERLTRLHLSDFLPFTLVLLDPGHALVARWNGSELSFDGSGASVLASSSLDFDGVYKARLRQFAGRDYEPAELQKLHMSHADGPSAYSPCMHRPDAGTVSLTRILVSPDAVECRYQPGSPCLGHSPRDTRLSRRRAA